MIFYDYSKSNTLNSDARKIFTLLTLLLQKKILYSQTHNNSLPSPASKIYKEMNPGHGKLFFKEILKNHRKEAYDWKTKTVFLEKIMVS